MRRRMITLNRSRHRLRWTAVGRLALGLAGMLLAAMAVGVPQAGAADVAGQDVVRRMFALYLGEPAPADETVPEARFDAMARQTFTDLFQIRSKAEKEQLGQRLAAIDDEIWGPGSAARGFDPQKPPAALVISYFLGQWAGGLYAPMVGEGVGDAGLPVRESYIMDFPFDAPALHLNYGRPYDRDAKTPGAWNSSPIEVHLTVVAKGAPNLEKAFDEISCDTSMSSDQPFKDGGRSKLASYKIGVWQGLPFCQKDRFYATETAHGSGEYVAYWRSSHAILVKQFGVVLSVVKNGPLIADPERQLFALKNMPAPSGTPHSAEQLARALLAVLEAKGAHDMAGFLTGDGVPPVIGLTDAQLAARAGQVAKAALDWAAAHRVSLRPAGSVPIYAVSMARYIALEEGTSALLRSGAEIRFYNAIKRRLAQSGPGVRPVGFSDLIRMGLDTAPRDGDVIRMDAVYLTIHNVIRLLARPEQWTPDTEGASEDIRRDEVALRIIHDIEGRQSTDSGPTMLELAEQRSPAGTIRRFPPDHARAGEVIDLQYTVWRLFAEADGLFQFQPNARDAHWNGGCHYYFWVGALGHHFGDDPAAAIGFWKEKSAKDAGGEHDRAVIQLSHFLAGARVDELLKDAMRIDMLKENPD